MKVMKLHLKGGESLSYDISIGYDVRGGIGRSVRELDIARRYIIITDANVAAIYGGMLLEELQEAGLTVDLIEFPAGEASKNIHTALSVVRQLLKLGVDRKSALIAFGGGVVGDLAGFVASLYMRSLPYMQIPTTLVAQVDSSIGGKTAIDLEEGKNLLGTFYQPRAVMTDPVFLETLPEEEFGNGLAEIVKYGIIAQETFFKLLEDEMEAVKKRERNVLAKVIKTSCGIKKGLVEIDEKDQGPRRFLNFGHTLGHALEAASGYVLSHGKGVSLGMMAAARLSEKICGFPSVQRERVEKLIEKAGLPTTIPGEISTDLIISKLTMDKKKAGKTINFVLLKKIGEPFVTGDVNETMLRETMERLKDDGTTASGIAG
jgi:3-dehydroquinate synthase